jgi:hypothetical protein
MTRPIALVLVPLIVAVALVACSPEPQDYDDLEGLAQAVAAAGVTCDVLDPRPKAQLVSDAGTCAVSGVTLYLFERARDLDDWKKIATRIGPAVIEANWAATGDAENIRLISKRLGGEVVSMNE